MQESKKAMQMEMDTNPVNPFACIPKDIIKIIISFHEALQWFLIDKRLCSIAKEVIDPKEYKKKYSIKLIDSWFHDDAPSCVKQFTHAVHSTGCMAFTDGLIAYASLKKKDPTKEKIYEISCVRLKTQTLLWKRDIPSNNERISLLCFKNNVGLLLSLSNSTTVTIVHPKYGDELSKIELPESDKNPIFLTGLDDYLLYRSNKMMYGIRIHHDLSSYIEWKDKVHVGFPSGCGKYFMYHIFKGFPTIIMSVDHRFLIDVGEVWQAYIRTNSELYVIKHQQSPNSLDVYLLNTFLGNSSAIPIMKSIKLNMESPEIIGIDLNGICVLFSNNRLIFVDINKNTIAICMRPIFKYGKWYFDRKRTALWYWESGDSMLYKHELEENEFTKLMHVKTTKIGQVIGTDTTRLIHVDEEENLYIEF